MEENLNKFEFSFDIKEFNPEDRMIYGRASFEEPDRDSEILGMEAFRKSIPIYRTNPVVRWKHKHPIGTAPQTNIEGKEFLVAAKIGKGFEPADTVWKMIEQGIVKAFSVGGKVKKREPFFDEKLGKEIRG